MFTVDNYIYIASWLNRKSMDSWCDLAARTTYKELSVPKNNELEVSWILSPYLAHFICDSKAVSDDEMRALLNDYDNYCLVSKEEDSSINALTIL